MNIQKNILCKIPKVYAVTSIDLDDKLYYIGASEEKNGKCFLVDSDNFKTHLLWDNPGGVMALVPIKKENGSIISIEKFYPVFKSEESCITKIVLYEENNKVLCTKEKLCNLPFVHRICIINENELIASTLCGTKAFTDDWSIPGGIYTGKYEIEKEIKMNNIYQGLSKNHGMFLKKDSVFVSSHEGVFKLDKNSKNKWNISKLIDAETSDIFLYDIDDDGNDELIAIQGFHGNTISIYKYYNNSYKCIQKLPLNFGHVLWAGKILNKNCILGGSRSGEKDLSIYWVTKYNDCQIKFEKEIIEKNIGPAQISIINYKNKTDILSANHASGELVLYSIL